MTQQQLVRSNASERVEKSKKGPLRRSETTFLTHDIASSEKYNYNSCKQISKLKSNHCDNNSNYDEEDVKLSDIIGGFGWFQLLVLIFSGLRESIVGFDAVVISIITQPERNFLCANNYPQLISEQPLTSERFYQYLNKSALNNNSQCFVTKSLLDDNRQYKDNSYFSQQSTQTIEEIACKSFIFNTNEQSESVTSLVVKWSLVCHRSWLVVFIQSAFFLGLVTGNLFWGYFADKVGRRKAYLVSHVISLVFGSAAIVVQQVELFILMRFFSAFGGIGYNMLYTIQVELIGTKYRSSSTILNHIGWGFGVLMVPIAAHTLTKSEYIIAVAPTLTLFTLPWAFWLPESSRWLMANETVNRVVSLNSKLVSIIQSSKPIESAKAKYEIIRAAKFNGKEINAELERKISMLNQAIIKSKLKQDLQTNKTSYLLLFSSVTLVKNLIIMSFIVMAAHLFYYSLTLNYSYFRSVSMEANFISSGIGEWIGCAVGAILMRYLSRRTCLFLFQLITSLSFLFQALIDLNLFECLNTTTVNTLNNAIGTFATLVTVFIILIVNQEVFPTIIRQTGSSLVNTVGEFGSMFAPVLTQLYLIIDSVYVNLFATIICLIGAFLSYLITETGKCELSDTVQNSNISNTTTNQASNNSYNNEWNNNTDLIKYQIYNDDNTSSNNCVVKKVNNSSNAIKRKYFALT